MTKNFPFYTQPDAMDCGPTCMRMIAKHYGKTYTIQELRGKSFITREGVSMLGISDSNESIGFITLGVRIPIEKFIIEAPLPFIAHWKQNHFIVVYKAPKNKSVNRRIVIFLESTQNFMKLISQLAEWFYGIHKVYKVPKIKNL